MAEKSIILSYVFKGSFSLRPVRSVCNLRLFGDVYKRCETLGRFIFRSKTKKFLEHDLALVGFLKAFVKYVTISTI